MATSQENMSKYFACDVSNYTTNNDGRDSLTQDVNTRNDYDDFSIPPAPIISQEPFGISGPIHSSYDDLDVPPAPIIPHSSYFDIPLSPESPSFDSASASTSFDSISGMMTPITPLRARAQPRIADNSPIASTSANRSGIVGLGFTGLLKADGSGAPLDGLGILPHRPGSPSFDAESYGPSRALLNEVFLAFSASESSPFLDHRSSSPFLPRQSRLQPDAGDMSPDPVRSSNFDLDDVFTCSTTISITNRRTALPTRIKQMNGDGSRELP